MGNRRIKFLTGITLSALMICQLEVLPVYGSVDFPLTEEIVERAAEQLIWDENGFRIRETILTSFNVDYVTKGDRVNIKIDNKSSTDPKYVTELGVGAFSGNNIEYNGKDYPLINEGGRKIETISLPRSINKIGDRCFDECRNLREVTFEPNYPYGDSIVPFVNLELGEYVFRNCISLKRIDLSDNPSGERCRISKVGKGLFEGCTSLEEVVLSESMTEIPDSMFKGCTSLKHIRIPSNITQIADNAFDGVSDLTIYCDSPSAAYDFAHKHGFRTVITNSPSYKKQKPNIILGVPTVDGKIVRYLDEGDFYLNPTTDGNGNKFTFKILGSATFGDVIKLDPSSGFVSVLGVGSASIEITVYETDVFDKNTKTVDVVIKDRNNPDDPNDPDNPGKNPGSDNSNSGDNDNSNPTVEQNIDLKEIEVTYGDSPFMVSPGSDFGKNISYSSSDNKVFKVNAAGKITIKGCGSAVLTIQSEHATRSIEIVVKPKVNNITSLQTDKRSITVKWKKDKKADGYYVYYSTNSKFKKAVKKKEIPKKNTTKIKIKKLKSGKKYYIRVTSYKKSGNRIIESDFCEIKNIKVK